MNIEHFSDEHGILVRVSDEVFLMTRDEARNHLLRLRELQAENAKLRELVRDMRKAFIHGPCYRWCEHMPEPCNGDKCQYVNRMRELGVEL